MELENFEGMSKHELLETMTPTQLRELRAELLIKLNEAEWGVHLINSVLEDKGCEWWVKTRQKAVTLPNRTTE